ncbi:hypothetical protein NPIL_222771 [Nephila pilipes]|uniref:Uncharacterized protein n=1 Tax=Nephila pilipes TaxID=299642 RepID=A0A8X6PY02_NEPPI|nr:hypothetical protein NPIL_222771 [Nephila pilipes]
MRPEDNFRIKRSRKHSKSDHVEWVLSNYKTETVDSTKQCLVHSSLFQSILSYAPMDFQRSENLVSLTPLGRQVIHETQSHCGRKKYEPRKVARNVNSPSSCIDALLETKPILDFCTGEKEKGELFLFYLLLFFQERRVEFSFSFSVLPRSLSRSSTARLIFYAATFQSGSED